MRLSGLWEFLKILSFSNNSPPELNDGNERRTLDLIVSLEFLCQFHIKSNVDTSFSNELPAAQTLKFQDVFSRSIFRFIDEWFIVKTFSSSTHENAFISISNKLFTFQCLSLFLLLRFGFELDFLKRMLFSLAVSPLTSMMQDVKIPSSRKFLVWEKALLIQTSSPSCKLLQNI